MDAFPILFYSPLALNLSNRVATTYTIEVIKDVHDPDGGEQPQVNLPQQLLFRICAWDIDVVLLRIGDLVGVDILFLKIHGGQVSAGKGAEDSNWSQILIDCRQL